ncbi:MAG: hypothetical protein AABZ23_04960 [Deltaproteobacteria bacterium]
MAERADEAKEENAETKRCFSARGLHYSIALLTVLALLGGILLQVASGALTSYFGFRAAAVGIVLIAGYVAIIVLLPVFFAHRLIGPFKRLEYEMRLVSSADLSKRLSIRSNDDLHVKNFIKYANEFIARFERMSDEHKRLNGLVSVKMSELADEISKDKFDCGKVKQELVELKKKLDDLNRG